MPEPSTSTLPVDVDEFLARPATSERVELVDGVVVVTPSASPLHQLGAQSLADALRANRPDGWAVFANPIDWLLQLPSGPRVRQPDVAVIAADQVAVHPQVRPPLLVAEVLSPDSAERDLVTKRAEYAAAGAQHYWIASVDEPSVLVLRLDGDAYIEVGRWDGDDLLAVEAPWPVRLRPTALLHP
jgi:Uma2 family endonuclease